MRISIIEALEKEFVYFSFNGNIYKCSFKKIDEEIKMYNCEKIYYKDCNSEIDNSFNLYTTKYYTEYNDLTNKEEAKQLYTIRYYVISINDPLARVVNYTADEFYNIYCLNNPKLLNWTHSASLGGTFVCNKTQNYLFVCV